jgi:FAD-dependent urate hydroxylase
MQSLNVIIAGAGIGGLCTAIALQQAGHRVHLYERAPELAPVGAAISIWPNGMKVLHALGVGKPVELVGGDMRSMSYSDHQGALLTRFSLVPLYQQVNQRAVPVGRAALQEILLQKVGAKHITLGVGCERFTELGNEVCVHLSTGEIVKADVLIAANGTHSMLRDQIAGESIGRHFCDYVNWNGRIKLDAGLGDPHEWTQYVGDNKRVSLMPMGEGEFYFFFDVPMAEGTPDIRDDYREELAGHFKGWAPAVQTLIKQLNPSRVARVEIHDLNKLPRLVTDRAALLGDAAHAMTPNIGQGGCQAMEDAWVLAQSLSQASTIHAGLQEYQRLRADRVKGLMSKARSRAEIIHGIDPDLTSAWYDELAKDDGRIIINGLAKTVLEGPF